MALRRAEGAMPTRPAGGRGRLRGGWHGQVGLRSRRAATRGAPLARRPRAASKASLPMPPFFFTRAAAVRHPVSLFALGYSPPASCIMLTPELVPIRVAPASSIFWKSALRRGIRRTGSWAQAHRRRRASSVGWVALAPPSSFPHQRLDNVDRRAERGTRASLIA
jgi:hypothetical protein